ncbi:MAG: hypothetical protein M1133_10715 [Armatimonadetes bacterium]|nr:hypothetical protein [Armatimonadota bacterium]
MKRLVWQYIVLYVAILGAFSMCAAFACYSGLLLIPTTDVVGRGEYSMEYQNDFSTPITRDNRATLFNTEYGISRGLELGFDVDASPTADTDAIGNIKYAFELGGGTKLPVAIGSYNMSQNLKSATYGVVGQTFGFGRLSLGALRTDTATRWFAGVDRPISDRWTLMADYTSGRENYWSVGANYVVSDRYSVLAGVEYPNVPGEDIIYSLHFVICGSLSHSARN